MSSMLASVVYIFPAIFSATNRPLLISLRSPETVMLPSGKASRAAISKRSGVVGATDLGVFGADFT